MLPTLAENSLHRSKQMELIAREADVHSRRGFELAGRRAYFSARAEFVKALRLVAAGLDAEHQTTVHGRALAAGLTALREADDFIPTGSQLEADLDLESIVGGHRTPILQNVPTDALTPLSTLQCYFAFAQEQLAAAVGNEVAGSMALHGLGNLHKALAAKSSTAIPAPEPKALVFYQAALLVNPKNHLASNELGVLLARGGRYEDARLALEHSLSIRSEPTAWYNLSVVYRRLGRSDLAQRADRLCRVAPGASGCGPQRPDGPAVKWVAPSVFARGSDLPASVQPFLPSPEKQAGSEIPQAEPIGPRPKGRVAQSPPWNPADTRN
jgi:tetratricopeptide (TPR) repeat protein